MINKQSLWFVTLFSLIVILSIYYFTTDQTNLSVFSSNSSKEYVASKDKEEDNISVLKVTDDEKTVSKIDELQDILLDESTTLEEKNNAYDELEVISTVKQKEDDISKLIKNEFDYKNFVKINDNQINVVISSKVHSNEIANNIIRKVQEKFDQDKKITVKFDSN